MGLRCLKFIKDPRVSVNGSRGPPASQILGQALGAGHAFRRSQGQVRTSQAGVVLGASRFKFLCLEYQPARKCGADRGDPKHQQSAIRIHMSSVLFSGVPLRFLLLICIYTNNYLAPVIYSC